MLLIRISLNLKSGKITIRRGGLGDVKVKRRLEKILQAELDPIRERRAEYEGKANQIMKCCLKSSKKARIVAQENLAKLKSVLGIDYQDMY